MEIFEIIRLISPLVAILLAFLEMINSDNMSRVGVIRIKYFEGIFIGMTIMGLLARFLIY